MSRLLVLASSSPRRREILERAGIPFLVRPSSIEERRHPGEPPVDYVRRLARAKAEACALAAGEVALGADTVVVIGDRVLEKPSDSSEAAAMLRLLAGREHEVLTGICLRDDANTIVDIESTRVRFMPLTGAEIADYVASGEPMDKAGAYAIQGLASKFVDRIEGCYWNVVGLPMARVYRHWKRLNAGNAS